MLGSARLPHLYWDLASECFCLLRNTQMMNGDGAWNSAHGKGHFKGKHIPFGALVHFIPSRTIMRSVPTKHDPNVVLGIFMGYVMSSGYTWNHQYKVAMVIDFANRNFHRSCSAEDHRFSLHTIGEVRMHSPAEFLLRAKMTKPISP